MKLATEAITVTRTAAGGYVNGRYVAGTVQVFTTPRGNIQPLNGRELRKLSEGDREKDQQKIYTAFELKNSDVVTRADGTTYEVQAVKDWTGFHQAHYQARLTGIEA